MLCPLAPHLAQKSPAEEGAAAIKAWCFFSIKKQKGVYDLFWEKVTHLVHFEYFFCFLFTCGFLGGRSIGSGVRRISTISNIFFISNFFFTCGFLGGRSIGSGVRRISSISIIILVGTLGTCVCTDTCADIYVPIYVLVRVRVVSMCVPIYLPMYIPINLPIFRSSCTDICTHTRVRVSICIPDISTDVYTD